MIITVDVLKAIAPGAKKTGYRLLPELAEYMNYWFPLFDIDQKGEYCHFLCQAAHETDSFNTLEEYATGKAYDGRADLGNIKVGDGIKYKGKGIFQTTGRGNYRALNPKWVLKAPDNIPVDFEETPKLLLKPVYAVWSACQYWDDRSFNDFANMPDDSKIYSKKLKRELSPLEYITWRINGAFNGFSEREKFYKRAKEIIN